MEGIAHVIREGRAELYYDEIPKEQRNGKVQMVASYFLLCSEAIYSVPVGTDVHQGGIFSSVPTS